MWLFIFSFRCSSLLLAVGCCCCLWAAVLLLFWLSWRETHEIVNGITTQLCYLPPQRRHHHRPLHSMDAFYICTSVCPSNRPFFALRSALCLWSVVGRIAYWRAHTYTHTYLSMCHTFVYIPQAWKYESMNAKVWSNIVRWLTKQNNSLTRCRNAAALVHRLTDLLSCVCMFLSQPTNWLTECLTYSHSCLQASAVMCMFVCVLTTQVASIWMQVC